MLTFKKWKTLNENFGGAMPLGLGQPSSIVGVVGAQFEEAKKAKKKMLSDKEIEDEDEDVDDVDGEEKEDDDGDDGDDKEIKIKIGKDADCKDNADDLEKEVDDDKPAFLMAKKKCKGCDCKSNKKMAKENKEWYSSVIGQLNSDPNAKFWDGFSSLEEEALIAPKDPNSGLVEPGQVGYAPVQRVGGWFS